MAPVAKRPKKASPKKKGAKKATARKASASKKKVAAKTKMSAPKKVAPKKVAVKKVVAASAPSLPFAADRVLAACGAIPVERALTEEEHTAMEKVAATARRFVDAEDAAPEDVVGKIAAFVDDVRDGQRPEPRSQDVRLGLGVLWGEQLRARAGWSWVHLTYGDGFASYALVPDDRAFACFPLNRVVEAMRTGARTNTSARVFESIRSGVLPSRRANTYLVIG